MVNIDTHLFIEIIESEGVERMFEEEIDNVRIIYFKALKGNTIIAICTSDEFISNRTAKSLLRELGIDNLIVSLFPIDDL